MKILHVNTLDTGGAATACRRIHLGLLDKGIDSKVLLLKKTKNAPFTYQFKPGSKQSFIWKVVTKIVNKIKEIKNQRNHNSFKNRKGNAEMFSFPDSLYDITESSYYKEADIIQLNWVSGFLDEPSFFKKNKKPVIWRMADLYPCGGGYHYEIGFPFDALRKELNRNYKIREASLSGTSITLVPISQWVKKKAEESALLRGFNKVLIHNGVDISVFRPHNKDFARKVFNLPDNKKILLFGSDNIGVERKGYRILTEALKLLKHPDVQLVVFGNNIKIESSRIINVGNIHDERLLAILYSASDYFIMPSQEEAFGQVTIEAMACGIPVISLPNGGSLDIIIHGINGLITQGFTSGDLLSSIEMALKIEFDPIEIVKYIQKNFKIEDKVEEYIRLYKSIL